MKTKNILLGLFVIGILFFSISYTYGLGEEGTEGEPGEGEEEGGDKVPDDDQDGIDDNIEEENKRDIEIWIGENVVEIASIKRSETQKDIIDLRVGYNEHGLSVRVSYGTFIEGECEHPEKSIAISPGDYCEDSVEYRLKFEVMLRGLIEFVDLNGDGVLDEEHDEVISDYGFHSFQPVDYSLTSISDDTNLHYLLFNTTDGVFAAHIYLVEEFVYVNDNLISPTEAKVDLEITNYEYLDNNSQLALIAKLWSQEKYSEREETDDEKEGYSDDEKDVHIQNAEYSGFFSWKETALIDGVEMEVLTKELEFEEEDLQVLLICYPRGYHIYHDPKIGIFIGMPVDGDLSILIAIGAISVVGVTSIIVVGVILRRRRIL